MKNFLKNNGIWVLFAAVVIAVALCLLTFFSSSGTTFSSVMGSVAAPFRAASTAIGDWFEDQQGRFADYNALLEENEALKKQLAEQEEALRQSEEDRAQNQRLRELLGLREQRKDFVLESVNVISQSTSNWTASLTLDHGADYGIAVDNCVITSEGYLVGIVSEVGSNWCTVLSVTDTDTEIGAQIFRTGEIGVAEGNFDLMSKGKLRMSYISQQSDVMNGDLVVTTGLGGYYPSDLVIGSVEDVRPDDSGLVQYAVVVPKADFEKLTEVFVIKDFDVVD